jgi:hypothetical protein
MKCTNDSLIELFIQDPRYKILEDGTILTDLPEKGHVSIRVEWRVKAVFITDQGYCQISYKGKKLNVHRIVYRYFHGKLDMSMEVNHEDGNRQRNHKDNLTLLTPKQNIQHSYNTLGRATNFGARKLTPEDALQIRLANEAGRSMHKLAEDYGVAKSTISYIVNNKTYAK